jgi:hypothetical protein
VPPCSRAHFDTATGVVAVSASPPSHTEIKLGTPNRLTSAARHAYVCTRSSKKPRQNAAAISSTVAIAATMPLRLTMPSLSIASQPYFFGGSLSLGGNTAGFLQNACTSETE